MTAILDTKRRVSKIAKGNYGVNALGGKASTGSARAGDSLSRSGVSRISESITNGGFLPDVFERGANTKSAGKHTNSIADIATRDTSSNNIATTFRNGRKKR